LKVGRRESPADRLRARGYELDEDGNTVEIGYGETADPWLDPLAEAARIRVMALTSKQRKSATRLTVWCGEGCALVKVSSTREGLLIHSVGEKVSRFDRFDDRDDEVAESERWGLAAAVFVNKVLERPQSMDSDLPLAYPCSCRHKPGPVYVDLRRIALLTLRQPDTRNVRYSDL
jgi:hypothetical protein